MKTGSLFVPLLRSCVCVALFADANPARGEIFAPAAISLASSCGEADPPLRRWRWNALSLGTPVATAKAAQRVGKQMRRRRQYLQFTTKRR